MRLEVGPGGLVLDDLLDKTIEHPVIANWFLGIKNNKVLKITREILGVQLDLMANMHYGKHPAIIDLKFQEMKKVFDKYGVQEGTAEKIMSELNGEVKNECRKNEI